MFRNTLTVIASLLFALPAFAQDTLWTKVYGGTGYDNAKSIFQFGDGGYIVGGQTSSFGVDNFDCLILRTDENGDTLWMKTYGGVGGQSLTCMQQTTDGGFIISGTYAQQYEDGKIMLMKLNADGDSLWSSLLGADTLEESTASVCQTDDGGFMLCGRTWRPVTSYDFWLLKTNPDGIRQWMRYYDWWNGDNAECVIQTPDGGYVITGSTSSTESTDRDVFLMKVNASGDSVWAHRYGGEAAEDASRVIQTSDGGFAIAGNTESYGMGGKDLYVIKTDGNGVLEWSNQFGSTYHDVALDIVETLDGGYVVTGSWYVPGVSWDACLLKLNSEGDSLWSRLYGGTTGNEYGYAIKQTMDNGYIIAGTTTSFGAENTAVYLIKIAPNIIGVEEDSNLPSGFSLEQNYPNPFNATTNIRYSLNSSSEIELTVYDLLGRKVQTLDRGFKKAGNHSVDFDASEFSSGIYFYKLSAGEFSETKKMVLLK
ncbi:MAG: T9SS type A sorting domain-containing protein [candidate division Zixibacteria bacterium]|nr:T9SS type A sorting domain-containing protein [candidate division Zixibacteria bacterium]